MTTYEVSDHFSTELEVCFEIKLYLASLMQRLPVGEILEFVSSDPNAEHELIPWADMRGYDLLDIQSLPDGQTKFLIRRQLS